MIGGKAIDDYLRGEEGVQWITALTSASIAKLERQGAIQLSLFDQRDLVSITHPDYPDERLVVCRKALLADERQRKREALPAATEKLEASRRSALKSARWSTARRWQSTFVSRSTTTVSSIPATRERSTSRRVSTDGERGTVALLCRQ